MVKNQNSIKYITVKSLASLASRLCLLPTFPNLFLTPTPRGNSLISGVSFQRLFLQLKANANIHSFSPPPPGIVNVGYCSHICTLLLSPNPPSWKLCFTNSQKVPLFFSFSCRGFRYRLVPNVTTAVPCWWMF